MANVSASGEDLRGGIHVAVVKSSTYSFESSAGGASSLAPADEAQPLAASRDPQKPCMLPPLRDSRRAGGRV